MIFAESAYSRDHRICIRGSRMMNWMKIIKKKEENEVRHEFETRVWQVNNYITRASVSLCSAILLEFIAWFFLRKTNRQFLIYEFIVVRTELERNGRICRRECSCYKNRLKFANTKCKMLNNGSSESDDSEIEAICRRTRGHDKVLATESEKKTRNGKNTADSRKTAPVEKPSTEDDNDHEMVLVPTGDDFDCFPLPIFTAAKISRFFSQIFISYVLF